MDLNPPLCGSLNTGRAGGTSEPMALTLTIEPFQPPINSPQASSFASKQRVMATFSRCFLLRSSCPTQCLLCFSISDGKRKRKRTGFTGRWGRWGRWGKAVAGGVYRTPEPSLLMPQKTCSCHQNRNETQLKGTRCPLNSHTGSRVCGASPEDLSQRSNGLAWLATECYWLLFSHCTEKIRCTPLKMTWCHTFCRQANPHDACHTFCCCS